MSGIDGLETTEAEMSGIPEADRSFHRLLESQLQTEPAGNRRRQPTSGPFEDEVPETDVQCFVALEYPDRLRLRETPSSKLRTNLALERVGAAGLEMARRDERRDGAPECRGTDQPAHAGTPGVRQSRERSEWTGRNDRDAEGVRTVLRPCLTNRSDGVLGLRAKPSRSPEERVVEVSVAVQVERNDVSVPVPP